MVVDPTTTKYLIKASVTADGVVEKPDIIGAIFGQTEGLMGNELDLRDLQKSARIGRVEVDIEQKGGKTTGSIVLPSAMDKVESAILAAGIETIDRIGPCKATIKVERIEDTRLSRRKTVVDRAKELLQLINDDPGQDSAKISEEVRSAVQVAEVTKFRGTKLPCGPNVESADSVILVEGRNDVINLLKCGVKNALAVEGTSVPPEVQEISREKTTIVFVDGDRGGELIAKELLQTCEVDFVARAPNTREVEELPHKLVMKCLKNKLSAEQFVSQMGIVLQGDGKKGGKKQPEKTEKKDDRRKRGRRGRDDDKDSDDQADRGRGRREARDNKRDDRDDRDAPRGDRSKRDEQTDRPQQTKLSPGDPRGAFKEILTGLSGSLKAVLLDDQGARLKEDLAVRELADTLKGAKDAVHAVVFDGVITQRLLDIAADKKIATVIGVKMGNVTKVPDTVEILTRDDLK